MKKRKIYEILITERERIISFMDSLMKCDDGYIHAIIILDGNVVPIGVSSDDYKNKNFDYDIKGPSSGYTPDNALPNPEKRCSPCDVVI